MQRAQQGAHLDLARVGLISVLHVKLLSIKGDMLKHSSVLLSSRTSKNWLGGLYCCTAVAMASTSAQAKVGYRV